MNLNHMRKFSSRAKAPHITPTPRFDASKQGGRQKHLLKQKTLKSIVNQSLSSQLNLKEISIVLFGFGQIGQSLVRSLLENRELHESVFHCSFQMKCIADSSGFIYNGNHSASDVGSFLSDPVLVKAMEWKSAANGNNSLRTFRDIGYYLSDFPRIQTHLLSSNFKQNTVLIDCTQPTVHYPNSNSNHNSNANSHLNDILLLHSQNKNAGIVLANTQPLIMDQQSFDTLTNADRLHRFGYESTVGGSLPVISQMQNLLISGDTVFKIEGILSSAMGYILSHWQHLRNTNLGYANEYQFADIVADAHRKGITERDPRFNLLGIESAQKAVILARSLGMDCNLSDVQIKCPFQALFGDAKQNSADSTSVEEFMHQLKAIKDANMEAYLLSYALDYAPKHSASFLNLKYVTVIDLEQESIVIELRNYGKQTGNNFDDGHGFNNDNFVWNSPQMQFAHVFSTQNMIQFTTDFYNESQPLVIHGACNRQSVVRAIMQDLYKVAIALD